MKIPSKDELQANKGTRLGFTPLPHAEYLLEIESVEEKTSRAYGSNTEEEDVLFITFNVVSLRDGRPAKDEKGAPAEGRKTFLTVNPKRTGFMQGGSPSKLRSLVAYALNVNVNHEIELDSWQDLVGKEILAEIGQYQGLDNTTKNKIFRFIPASYGD